MGHVLHARARTTPAVRREIQNSQESLITLAARYGVNPKAIEKWRKRDFVHDAPMGPKVIRSRSLNQVEEAAIVAFRVLTQLPLDDCLYSLQSSIPHLAPSSLHRCLQRNGPSVLPKEKAKKEEIQNLSHRLFSCGYSRSANRGRQIISFHSNRQNIKICLRGTVR